MNGQKILQNLNNNVWKTSGKIKKVEEGIEPGIYNIFLAENAVTTNEKYEGLILLVDKINKHVYQKVETRFIMHRLESFKSIPTAGETVSIQYDTGQLNICKSLNHQDSWAY